MDTQRVQTILEEFLEKLTIEVESIEVTPDDTHPIFSIQTPDAKKLIGIKGENLRSLNFIVKRIAEKRLSIENPSFLVDINGYQQERNDSIIKTAKILIERTRTFKTSTEMDPLNAYERMLVHSLVADDPEIETESHGEGRMKTITIRYVEPAAESGAPLS